MGVCDDDYDGWTERRLGANNVSSFLAGSKNLIGQAPGRADRRETAEQ